MIKKKTQMKVHKAVQEYIDLWQSEYKLHLQALDYRRANMKDEFASIPSTYNIKRALYSIPERLLIMIYLKLDDMESDEWTKQDSQLWFTKTFNQFSLTKEV